MAELRRDVCAARAPWRSACCAVIALLCPGRRGSGTAAASTQANTSGVVGPGEILVDDVVYDGKPDPRSRASLRQGLADPLTLDTGYRFAAHRTFSAGGPL